MKIKNTLCDFDNYVEQMLKEWKVPGAAIAIVKDGQILLEKGYGYSNIETKKAVTRETIFPIASNTKAFTAMGAGILVDEGKLHWDTPIKEYIPWFEMYDSVATDRITMRDLLCHRSGLPGYEFAFYNGNYSLEEYVKKLRYLEPNIDFRSAWQYQNQVFAVAGYVISQISGKSWEEFINEKIVNQLDMRRSSFSAAELADSNNHATPYALIKGNVKAVEIYDTGGTAPSGSINSCVSDMIKWIMLHLGKGQYNNKRIIAEETLNEMHTPQMVDTSYPWVFAENPVHTYGLAWYIQVFRGKKIIMHTGNIDGFSAVTSFMPDENIGMVILTNMNESYLDVVLQYEIYDRLCGFESKDWSSEIKKQEEYNAAQAMQILNRGREVLKAEGAPGRKPEEYVGEYLHPAYGKINVYLKGEELYLSTRKFNSKLKPWGVDVFSWDPSENWPASAYMAYMTGFRGTGGKISELWWQTESDSNIKPITFKKIK